MRELLVIPGVMWTFDAGFRTLNGYSAIYDAAIACPLGNMNTLLDCTPVRRHVSSDVPMLELAPLSDTVDGIVPFNTPHLISSSL